MCPINQQQQQQRTNGAQQHQRRSSDCSVIVTARSNRQHQQHYVQRPVPPPLPPLPPSVPQSTGAIWSSSSVVEPRTNISNSSFDAAYSAIHVSDQPRENIHTHMHAQTHAQAARNRSNLLSSVQFSFVVVVFRFLYHTLLH